MSSIEVPRMLQLPRARYMDTGMPEQTMRTPKSACFGTEHATKVCVFTWWVYAAPQSVSRVPCVSSLAASLPLPAQQRRRDVRFTFSVTTRQGSHRDSRHCTEDAWKKSTLKTSAAPNTFPDRLLTDSLSSCMDFMIQKLRTQCDTRLNQSSS